MSFGKAFGQLIKKLRAEEGLTQEQLARLAFGDEGRKTRISELENGKVAKPQAKTVDLLVVALNIPQEKIDRILNETPHPGMLGTLIDFFDLEGSEFLDTEVATNGQGAAVFFHDRKLKEELKRVEFFVEERMIVLLQKSGINRRPSGLPMGRDVSEHLKGCSQILFVRRDPDTGEAFRGNTYPLKVVY